MHYPFNFPLHTPISTQLFKLKKTFIHISLTIPNHPNTSLLLIQPKNLFFVVSVDSVKMEYSPDFYQNVVVMRHGDRIDNFDPSWVSTATCPWDPSLFQAGRVRALETGRRIRQTLGFPIHRVFVSPFLRCVQTASQVVTALCAVDGDLDGAGAGADIPIDPSKVKVSVEYGLCEMMNRKGIRADVAPKDGIFSLDILEREAMIPLGTVDTNVERLYKELPQWEEPVLKTRARYEQVFKDLADKYPTQNLLLVTHGEAVDVAISSFIKGAKVYEIEYCAYVELRRPIFQKAQKSYTAGNFKVLTHTGETGICYSLPKSNANQSHN